jgi:hypothetical protein
MRKTTYLKVCRIPYSPARESVVRCLPEYQAVKPHSQVSLVSWKFSIPRL